MRKSMVFHRREEEDVLGRAFREMKMEDMEISRRKSGLMVHDSEGNRWRGAEIYRFLLHECLAFTPDGTLMEGFSMDERLIAELKEWAGEYGVYAREGG